MLVLRMLETEHKRFWLHFHTHNCKKMSVIRGAFGPLEWKLFSSYALGKRNPARHYGRPMYRTKNSFDSIFGLAGLIRRLFALSYRPSYSAPKLEEGKTKIWVQLFEIKGETEWFAQPKKKGREVTNRLFDFRRIDSRRKSEKRNWKKRNSE